MLNILFIVKKYNGFYFSVFGDVIIKFGELFPSGYFIFLDFQSKSFSINF